MRRIADRRGADAAEVALAWLLARPNVIVIPKSSDPAHVRANRAAADLILEPEDLAALEKSFPKPQTPQSLATT